MSVKKYYSIRFHVLSPVNIGADDSENTDKDVLKDSRGFPFIPGSSLAGVYRSLFEENEQTDKWFGNVVISNDSMAGGAGTASLIKVYDGETDSSLISTRDNVSLDEWKTSLQGSKFDYEIIEPGAVFQTYLEIDQAEDDPGYGNAIINAWLHNRIYIGSKTSRGLGHCGNAEIKCASFDFNKQDDIERWLDFDMFHADDSCWQEIRDTDEGMPSAEPLCVITLHLKQRGGISIRRYTTTAHDSKEDASVPDFMQLKMRRLKNGKIEYGDPVVPGTEWAGMFRHAASVMDPEDTEDFFGTADQKNKHQSAIRFSETVLSGGEDVVLSRSAIDRVSGGAQDKALFTESTYYGGSGELQITLMKEPSAKMKKTIAACIADLNAGMLCVGGETSIGRGMFTIEKAEVDGRRIAISEKAGTAAYSQKLYQEILEALA